MEGPVVPKIKQYEEAIRTFYAMKDRAGEAERANWRAERAQREAEEARGRKLIGYWMTLSGTEFERELGILYGYLGFGVELTPSSGDQGVDLILRKDGKTTIVQCKSHKNPVGPAVARELYGSLAASGADDAILACTGGFTQGVREFVRDKAIGLIAAPELAEMAGKVEYQSERIEVKPEDQRIPRPTCPEPGCGKTMILRTGQYGRFWGCPDFPKCRGTRRAAQLLES